MEECFINAQNIKRYHLHMISLHKSGADSFQELKPVRRQVLPNMETTLFMNLKTIFFLKSKIDFHIADDLGFIQDHNWFILKSITIQMLVMSIILSLISKLPIVTMEFSFLCSSLGLYFYLWELFWVPAIYYQKQQRTKGKHVKKQSILNQANNMLW